MTTSISYTTDPEILQTEVSKLFSYPVKIGNEQAGNNSIRELDKNAVGVLVVHRSQPGAVRVFGGAYMENVQTSPTNVSSFTLLYIKPGQTCWVLGQSSYRLVLQDS
ncbi:hypothetical protein VTK73DRAFT_6192 [Phialemonium thermophilum]|uniref:Uncharacterized protein n=1 Tax=Phialemonium thermophilum TaxID=223376 RepID=A0ABR3WKA3_9PEZI